jgi:hypothetical protein
MAFYSVLFILVEITKRAATFFPFFITELKIETENLTSLQINNIRRVLQNQ